MKKIHEHSCDGLLVRQIIGTDSMPCVGVCDKLKSTNLNKVSTRGGKGRYDQGHR